VDRLKILIGSYLLVVISGCSETPLILHVGECERGIVIRDNLADIQKIWPDAQITDVLISGGCYQDKFIRKSNRG
jgi:hypothetical protein